LDLSYVPVGKEMVCEDVYLAGIVSKEDSLVDIFGSE
jgi:hypothetical protein